jgi:2-polyprenyl-3-methyl-5-hydroxy-6-metoxy-1,4-benzoquinol methylase
VRFLAERAVDAVEEMDRPDCDERKLERTYRQFPVINWAVSGWHGVYRRQLRPLLDIGSGGGDIPRAIAKWAARDGIPLEITAIDPDERAHAFAVSRPKVDGLVFQRALSSELVAQGRTFDLATSNHLLHHLDATQLPALLSDSQQLCRRAALHNDIRRSPLAYALFSAGIFPGSYIRRDGLTSIRRSYTSSELQQLAPPGWTVSTKRPFHHLLSYRPQSHA